MNAMLSVSLALGRAIARVHGKELYEVMRREHEIVDMERKLEELREKKTFLEKEIKLIQAIIEKKK